MLRARDAGAFLGEQWRRKRLPVLAVTAFLAAALGFVEFKQVPDNSIGDAIYGTAVLLRARDAGAFLGEQWRRKRLPILAVTAFLAAALGFVGFMQVPDNSIGDAIYGTVAVLTFNYSPPESGTPNWYIEVARNLAPAVTAYATFAAITAVLQDQWQQLRARRRRGHVLVCGLGDRGMQIVRSYRRAGLSASVVAVEADATSPNVAAARRLGALVVTGDATDAAVLQIAGGRRAGTLISVCDEDATNASVASAARRLERRPGEPLAVFCHAARPALVDDLTSVSIAGSGPQFTVEWFSVLERASRLLLTEYARIGQAATRDEPPHLAVVGTDDMAEPVVTNAGRAWRALGRFERRLRVTVVGDGARVWVTSLVRRSPSLPAAVCLDAYEDDLRAPANAASARAALGDATAVFVFGASDSAGLEAGFALKRILDSRQPVVVRVTGRGEGLLDTLSGGGTRTSAVHLFDPVERTCSAEMITGGVIETLARALHGIYIEQSARAPDGDTGRPTASYEQLDPQFKDATRAQARDVARKLERIGCVLLPLSDWDATVLELSADEVEQLAELEHKRWNDDRLAQGWKPGLETNRERKVNRWVNVPWESLPEQMREFDRAFVRAIPRALASAGYEVRRVRSGA